MKGIGGIIPILINSGIINPGVFGPMITASFCFANSNASIVSLTGTCSGIATSNLIPEFNASFAACKKNFAGTKIIETFAFVASTASCIVLYTGIVSSNFCPPLPGVTPATTLVPYAIICFACSEPYAPVIP